MLNAGFQLTPRPSEEIASEDFSLLYIWGWPGFDGWIQRFPILRGSHRLAGTKPTTNPPMVSSVFGEDDDDETNFKIKTFLEMI